MAQNDHGQGQGNDKHTFNIVVNGTQETWEHPNMNYEQIIRLAFPQGPFGGDVRYTVSWTKPGGQEGSLRQGQHVDVVDGMTFDVRNTDKS